MTPKYTYKQKNNFFLVHVSDSVAGVVPSSLKAINLL